MRIAIRNVVVAVVAFAVAVGADYLYIHHDSAELEILFLVPFGFAMYLLVPAGFWWANMPIFAQTRKARLLNALLAVGLSVVWSAIIFVPYLWAHFAMGGQH
jgi:hypothetical protein